MINEKNFVIIFLLVQIRGISRTAEILNCTIRLGFA